MARFLSAPTHLECGKAVITWIPAKVVASPRTNPKQKQKENKQVNENTTQDNKGDGEKEKERESKL